MPRRPSARVELVTLLRRRRTTLGQFIVEFGITSRDGLLDRCARLGVVPPDDASIAAALPVPLAPAPALPSSPQAAIDHVDGCVDSVEPAEPVRQPGRKRSPSRGSTLVS